MGRHKSSCQRPHADEKDSTQGIRVTDL